MILVVLLEKTLSFSVVVFYGYLFLSENVHSNSFGHTMTSLRQKRFNTLNTSRQFYVQQKHFQSSYNGVDC